MSEAENIIKNLGLQPHPEGGYFKETYRSKGLISEDNLNSSFLGHRNYATSNGHYRSEDDRPCPHRFAMPPVSNG